MTTTSACDLFIDNIQLIDGKHTKPSTISITSGKITALGESKPALAKETLDGHGMLALPAFYNAHSHASMTLMRGYGDDMRLKEWLEECIWPAETKLTQEAVYWGGRLAACEMIRTGTVFFNDMYWFFPAIANAVKDSGIRAQLPGIFIKFKPDDFRGQAKEYHQRVKAGEWSHRVQFALGPHAPYSVTRDTFEWIADYAKQHDVPVHVHLSENAWEVDQVKAEYGVRPAFAMEKLGLLNKKFMAAHCVWLDESEFELFGKAGATCLHCPCANMKLSVGGEGGRAFQYQLARKHNVRVALGTDGVCSNNNTDMFKEMKFAALLAKHQSGDPTLLPAREAWQMATRATAEAVGLDAGRIGVGALADIILLRTDDVLMTPTYDPVSNLVYSAHGHLVDTTICDGKVLMRGGVVPGLAEVRTKVAECIKSMGWLK